ncbi:hypothetical protein TWF718_001150 [Orbilia javanica]|uniref:Uncharacterized protein n=1 Tax=Orbilia javanica TaxID=47235 RepID=A0AAN8NH60_9PEZI
MSTSNGVQLYDPVTEFCALYHHTTVVVEDQLYIVQGYMQYIRNGRRKGAANPYLRFINLNDNITVAQSGEHVHVVNNRTEYPERIPATTNPILWYNLYSKQLLMFMGATVNPQAFILQDESNYNPGSPTELWVGTYRDDVQRRYTGDTNNYDRWSRSVLSSAKNPTGLLSSRTNHFDVTSQKGYIVGGWVDAKENPTNGFIVWDMFSNTWTNSSMPWTTQGDGVMGTFWIDSTRLIHVLVGGYIDGSYAAFDHARVYDTQTQDWYIQEIQGDVPAPRVNACGAVAYSSDGSSYQLYMYGGSENDDQDARFLSDLWVLSIPSFTWVLLDDSRGEYAPGTRSGASCDIVKDHILAIYGGKKSAQAGQVAQCEANGGALYFMDLNTQTWLETYDGASIQPNYSVPKPVYDIIGGDGSGGATVVAPPGGFKHDVLATIFAINGTRVINNDWTESPRPEVTSDAPAVGPSSPPTGAIVGGVVGGALLIALAVFILFFLRKKKRGIFGSSEGKTMIIINDIPVGGRSELPVHSDGGSYQQNLSVYKDPRAGYSGYYQSTVLGAPTTGNTQFYELPTSYSKPYQSATAQELLQSPQDEAESPNSATNLVADHDLPLPPTPPGAPAPQFRDRV